MPSDLATYFAEQSQKQNAKLNTNSGSKISNNENEKEYLDDDDMGPSTSMAVEADDDDTFERSTFNLKRTRSMGLFDDYIDPTKKLLGKADSESNGKAKNSNRRTNDNDEDNDKHSDKGEDEKHGKYDKNSGDYSYEDEDEYNSDSDSLGSEDSDEDSNDESEDDYDYQNDGLERYDSYSKDDYLSPSVSPPPADNDNYLLPQDDNDLLREPERHVDYLSHDWNELDISNSWKYIILRKKKKSEDLVNAARLENASWRTWAKARNHLKTVSPEVVNWSKDSDVTWLYGPIVRGGNKDGDDETEIGYGSDDETSKRLPTQKIRKKSSKSASSSTSSTSSNTPKPILKKRSVSEIIEENSLWKLNEARKHINDLKYTTAKHGRDDYDDYDALAAKVNAQYFQQSNLDQKKVQKGEENLEGQSDLISTNVDNRVPHLNAEKDKEDVDASNQCSNDFDNNDNKKNEKGGLSSILTSSNANKTEQPQKDRHIHFNDRVQQCMAIGRTFSSSDTSDDEDYDENTYNEQDSSQRFFNSDENTRSGAISHVEDRSASSSSEEEEDDDDDDAGLFINPTISRRADSNSHYAATDTSSQSSAQSKISFNPIIKPLPATTLNYGSDDEASDNSDYNGSYGNAVSHNVNTYRGYDYMYDYNSVYTGDTSNFLPVDNCDVVDIPEGLNLHSAMASDTASNYELNHPITVNPAQYNRKSIYDGDESDGSNSGEQFIENSIDKSSDDESDGSNSGEQFIENSAGKSNDGESHREKNEDDDTFLKRSVSFGKNNTSNSLRDLTKQSSTTSLKPATARSFISGERLESSNDNASHLADAPTPNFSSVNSSASGSRPRFLKRNSSSSNFIFDSEEEDESDDDSITTGNQIAGSSSLREGRRHTAEESPTMPKLEDSSKSMIPQSTTIRPGLSTNVSSSSSDPSKSIRIKHSSSPPEVRSSDIAISGSFSPLYDSAAKSISSKKGILNKSTANELYEVNKDLEACHIDENENDMSPSNVNINQTSNESMQKMMQNARDIAQKYLHSWKKTDEKQGGHKTDVLKHR